eukprot:Mycagemm_TRINITY_DN9690_c0_g1::TRINITY_DN9690_c0_g1_i1::g.2513::m.2513 type:complete len:117 gc:universal TRINITY_DN9690_c0_g1_i1:333-683(+)
MVDLQMPLALNVIERRGRDDREAEKENVGFRIAERTETRILFLAGSIPQGKVDKLAVYLNTGGKVVENGGHVVHWESVLCVANQQAGLTDSTVADYDAFDVLHSHVRRPHQLHSRG